MEAEWEEVGSREARRRGKRGGERKIVGYDADWGGKG
jgi:hypothetical protein